jgi:hypothetical protein
VPVCVSFSLPRRNNGRMYKIEHCSLKACKIHLETRATIASSRIDKFHPLLFLVAQQSRHLTGAMEFTSSPDHK